MGAHALNILCIFSDLSVTRNYAETLTKSKHIFTDAAVVRPLIFICSLSLLTCMAVSVYVFVRLVYVKKNVCLVYV